MELAELTYVKTIYRTDAGERIERGPGEPEPADYASARDVLRCSADNSMVDLSQHGEARCRAGKHRWIRTYGRVDTWLQVNR